MLQPQKPLSWIPLTIAGGVTAASSGRCGFQARVLRHLKTAWALRRALSIATVHFVEETAQFMTVTSGAPA